MAESESKDTPKKRKFIEGILLGMNGAQAARYSGSPAKTARQYASYLSKDPFVQNILAEERAKQAAKMKMSREKVQKIVTDAVEMAQTLADPATMIRGAQELNKMCGFYAPEEKKVTIEGELRQVQMQFEQMSESELLEAIGRGSDPIEAEFEVLGLTDSNAEHIADDC